MKVTIEVSSQTIADIMITAIESGDPVTTASRGGWCAGIYAGSKDTKPPKNRTDPRDPWYADPLFWEHSFVIQVDEVDDETGHITAHFLTEAEFAEGLALLAETYPLVLGDLLGDLDAAAADSFLQFVTFGRLVYG
jgi:hypothetical protein